MKRINDAGLELIKKWEGWRPSTYKCSAGRWTIGYGSTWTSSGARVTETHPDITKEQGELLLRREVKHVEQSLDKLFPKELPDNMHGALGSFAYNLGTGALQRSTLRSMILRGAYEDAADQFERWCRAGGRKLRGLLLRRYEERDLYLTDLSK